MKYLNFIDKIIVVLKYRSAQRAAFNREYKKKLYKIRYGKDKIPLSHGKILTDAFVICCFILIGFIMFATIYLRDSSMMLALIAPMLSGLVALVTYQYKSLKENSAGGIVFESALEKIRNQFDESSEKAESHINYNNSVDYSTTINNDDAVG